jgi:hypothetical protein
MPSPQRHRDASATQSWGNNKAGWGIFPHKIDFSDKLLGVSAGPRAVDSTKSRKFVPTLLKVQSGAWPYMSGDCIALPAILWSATGNCSSPYAKRYWLIIPVRTCERV